MIRIERLTKTFRGIRAVDDVTFEVQPREILGLLGPNGAGKSTLVGMMLGLIRADAGAVWIRGVSVQRDRPRALRGVGAVLESAACDPHLTGWQNVARLASWSGGAPADAIARAADFVGLTGRIHDPAGTYSRGMRLRLALAQALVPQPEVLVLDEPLEGLDPAAIRDVRALVARLRDEWAVTVVFSSHLLGEVERLCDRVAVLDAGRLALLGACRDGGDGLEARYLAAVERR
jgi:ABC-2 type transport system ATP-binding protein